MYDCINLEIHDFNGDPYTIFHFACACVIKRDYELKHKWGVDYFVTYLINTIISKRSGQEVFVS